MASENSEREVAELRALLRSESQRQPEPDLTRFIMAYAALVPLGLLVLALQQEFGPRFGVNRLHVWKMQVGRTTHLVVEFGSAIRTKVLSSK